MKRTCNSRVNSMTLTCDLELEVAGSCAVHILSLRGTFSQWVKFNESRSKG